MHTRSWPRRLVLTAALASTTLAIGTAGAAGHRGGARDDHAFRLPDHYEFDATLAAGFRADAAGLHAIRLAFDYPAGSDNTFATWQVDVLDRNGVAVQRFLGEAPLSKGRGLARLAWNGRHASGPALPVGFYTLRLRAVPSVLLGVDASLPLAERAARSFALASDELIEQRYDVQVGAVAAPRMPAFHALPHAAQAGKAGVVATSAPAGSLPYTIYYGNLHSQTNHSDGGTPLASCAGAENPQAGTMGPAEAYAMMQNQAGGDFLLTSEHNHMYDGSTGTNASATPA
ncbi:MAG: carbohydrate-binding protein CenC, partial [Arenimonas sp.]